MWLARRECDTPPCPACFLLRLKPGSIVSPLVDVRQNVRNDAAHLSTGWSGRGAAVGSADGILPQHAVRAQEHGDEGGLERQRQLAANVEPGSVDQAVRHTRHEGAVLAEGPSQGGDEHRLASRVRDGVRERRHGRDFDILEHR